MQNLARSVLLTAIATTSAVADNDIVTEREQAAREVSERFITELGGQLKQQMQSAGPVAAISVCRDVAPQIARDLSLEHGWKVTRVSDKVRNPLLGMPDAWESEQLRRIGARLSQGENIAELSVGEMTMENGKQYYRFMKPIGTKPICLTCHGDDDTVPEAVQASLAEAYPHDRARGYSAGQLRGAVSIKQPIDITYKP